MSKISFEKIEEIVESIDTHLGRQILIRLERNGVKINQVNISTGESETHGSVRLRSIRVAQALTSRGIGLGKILMLCGNNHLDLAIPAIASLYVGTAVMTLAVNMTHMEIKNNILLGKPDIIFCDAEVALTFQKVLMELNYSTEIVVFGEKPRGNYTSFEELSKPTGNENQFQSADFNPKTTTAFIILSSGTTGMSKGVCLTHENFAIPILVPEIFEKYSVNLFESVLTFSSYAWTSAILLCMTSALKGMTRFQTHLPFTPEIALEAINKYKPNSIFLTPIIISSLLYHPQIKECDFSSVHAIACLGSNATHQNVEELQKYLTNGQVENYYGVTETGPVCRPFRYKRGACGQLMPWYKWKVVDAETREELGPHKVGELLLYSPWTLFKCYYGNPAATVEAFDGDWFRTGDLVYYDEEEDFFIVDRLKEMLKFRNYQKTCQNRNSYAEELSSWTNFQLHIPEKSTEKP